MKTRRSKSGNSSNQGSRRTRATAGQKWQLDCGNEDISSEKRPRKQAVTITGEMRSRPLTTDDIPTLVKPVSEAMFNTTPSAEVEETSSVRRSHIRKQITSNQLPDLELQESHNIGKHPSVVTKACFQSCGTMPWCNEAENTVKDWVRFHLS